MSEQKRGIKGRVYLSDEQVLAAGHQFGCGRFVYNRLLEFSQERYFTDKTKTSPKDRSLELTRLKTELPWLREVNAQSLQQTGRALDSAYKNWIDSITGKRPDQVKPPKFKKKSQRQSARFTRGSFSFRNGVLHLSKIGDMHIPESKRCTVVPRLEHDTLRQILCFVPSRTTVACYRFSNQSVRFYRHQHQNISFLQWPNVVACRTASPLACCVGAAAHRTEAFEPPAPRARRIERRRAAKSPRCTNGSSTSAQIFFRS